jgi:hypothetical protein
MEANQDDSMEDSLEPGCYKREPSGNTKDASIPLAAFHPKLGLIDMDTSFLRSTKSGGKSLEPTISPSRWVLVCRTLKLTKRTRMNLNQS